MVDFLKRYMVFIIAEWAVVCPAAFGQNPKLQEGIWRAALTREDYVQVIFNMEVKYENKLPKFFVLNDTERIEIRDFTVKGDSVNFRMPAYESEFFAAIRHDGSLKGIWVKGTAGETQHWQFEATPGLTSRFGTELEEPKFDVSGKWLVELTRLTTGKERTAVAEWKQNGNRLTGTVLTPTGDYRYLEGVVTGDSLKLSVFDGAHAYLFLARISDENTIHDGMFYSGYAGIEKWNAFKRADAGLNEDLDPQLKEGFIKLNFSFRDLNGKMVSINDERFRNKAVVVQIMGSWCPNCLDETRFLSDYYNANKDKGVEMVALAYEYSTDFERSVKSVRRFQQLFNVQYPMLITGVTNSDSLKTEKTLPQITPIKAFPTLIFIDKKGDVRGFHTSFYGPGTGGHFLEFKKVFSAKVNELLNEK